MASEFQSSDIILPPDNPISKSRNLRTLIAYWILGLCNNYGYVVMLTAAEDIIKNISENDNNHTDTESFILNATAVPAESYGANGRECTYLSTGAILLADVVPAFLVKLVAPFLPFYVNVRVAICVLVACSGFLTVSFSETIALSILGVALTSFCSGLGEVTFLQYSSHFDKNVLSTWSSGTGGAGIIGAVSYSILQKIGLRTTLIVMLVVPITMGISFWFILPKPSKEEMESNLEVHRRESLKREELTDYFGAFKKKLKLLPGLLKYMIPLGSVYLFEYFINQGTFELIKFKHSSVEKAAQYHWLQVAYQVGVFISRSSVNLFHIKYIWIMSLLQFVNVILYTTEAVYYYIPNFYIVIAFTLWEGLLGGAAYVNTFYRISIEVPAEDKQFSLGITSFADSIGISLAGILAIYAHNIICDLPLPSSDY